MKKTIQTTLYRTAIAVAVLAANSTMAAGMLEEVVVTAEKREQNLQDTPLAIEALTEAAIENQGITDIKSLFDAIPGVQGYEAPSSRGNVSFYLRGVGAGNPNSVSSDPANAMYIDGVYLGKATGNAYIAHKISKISESIARGSTISNACLQTKLFSPLVIQMLVLGEETGKMDDMLDDVSDFYDREVDYDLDKLAEMIEPILLVVMAGMVLILALGVFLPMWDMASLKR